MSKSWVYHREKEATIINDSELEKYLKNGWSESPVALTKIKNFQKKENATETLNKMTVEKLIAFAKDVFNENLSPSFEKEDLIEIIQALINKEKNGDCS